MIDTATFPQHATLFHAFHGGRQRCEIEIDGSRLDLAQCRVGWWRRPQPFALDPGLAPEAVAFAYSECNEAVAGLLAALSIPWVNPPDKDETAHHKPYQLAVASAVGLAVPRTVITNDPAAARRLIDELGPQRTVYKTFLATEQCWRETRVVKPEELAWLDRVRLAPLIFQEYVPAIHDVRVTVVGPAMFAAAISPAPGGYAIDYRMDIEGAAIEPVALPEAIARKLKKLLDRMGLRYGAIDLRRTPDDRYVFLEINPAGEWRFVEERTGQPITAAMAKLLKSMDR